MLGDSFQRSTRFGVAFGRFQPFHLDHLAYIKAAREKCDVLYIGITNADPSQTAVNENDVNRSLKSSNPLTYWERALLVQSSLLDAGIRPDQFVVTPLPINRPDLIQYYVPENAQFFITIYDDWGEEKRRILTSRGFKVNTLWQRPPSEKGIAGTSIREKIVAGEDWKHLVPNPVFRLMKTLEMDIRIQTISRTETKGEHFTIEDGS